MVTRKMLTLALAATAGVLVPLATLRPVADAQAPLPAMAQPGMGDTGPASQRHLDEALAFRSRLRPWALSHRVLLRQLRCASPHDWRALQAVYAQLPPLPLYRGDPRVAPTGSSMPLLVVETPGFSPRHLVHADDPTARMVQQNYTRYHDLKLASTLGVGTDNYSVWASGRVTKTHMFSHSQGQGQFILIERTENTLVPPFDFLR